MRWFGLLVLICACGHAPRDPVVQNRTEAPYVPPRCSGDPPACLPEAGLIDAAGVDRAPSLEGKVVILEYWASWCHPCVADVARLNAVAERYVGQDVAILGVSTEGFAPDELAQALHDYDLRYPVLPVTPSLAALLDVPTNIPTGYVYDKHGTRQDVHVGMWDEAELTETIERLLAEP